MCEKIDFDSEYALQHLTNDRLKIIFDLEFITYEFQFKGLKINGLEFKDKMESLRIDGLAFDKKTNAFVIIEYKNRLNQKVFEQGKNYYYNLIEPFEGKFKEGFKKEEYYKQLEINKCKLKEKYEEKFNETLDGEDCFKNAKVMIISPKFLREQEESETPKYPHEIYEVSLYKCDEIKGYVSYKRINTDVEKRINVNLGNLKLTKCTLLYDKSNEIKELYNTFENTLLNQFAYLDLKYFVDLVAIRVQNKKICLLKVNNAIKIEFSDEAKEILNLQVKDEILNQENMKDIIDSINEVYVEMVE